MRCLARSPLLLCMLATLATGSLYADNSGVMTGSRDHPAPFWQGYSADMSDQEYRNTYRSNRRHVSKFIASYSENALLSLGVPQGGISVMGAAAGLAIKHDATIYLGKSRLLVLDLQDVTEDSRAVTFGIKLDW